MSPHIVPFALPTSSAPAVWRPSRRVSILATGAQTNNAFSMLHCRYHTPGAHDPVWLEHDAIIYVLKGHAVVEHDSQEDTLLDGETFFIPKFTTFRLKTEEAELLLIYIPAGPEQLELLLGTPAFSEGHPPAGITNPPEAYIASHARQYGVHVFASSESTHIAIPPPPSRPLSIQPRPFKTNALTAPAFWVQPQVPELWTVLVSALQTNNAVTLTEISFTAGHAAGPLKYHFHDEAYYVLAGSASVLLDNRHETVTKGDFVFIPRGTVFGVTTLSNDFVALTLHTPSGIIEGALPLLGAIAATERRLPRPGDLPPRESLSPEYMATLGAHMRVLGIDSIKTGTS